MLKKLFRTGERELIESLREHLSLSREALALSLAMLRKHSKLDLSQVLECRARIVDLEKRGDRIYDAAVSSVLKGAFPLPLITELGTLLDDLDDILDLIYFLGMELARGIKAGLTRNPTVAEIYEVTGDMAEKAAESLSSLEALLSHILKDMAKAVEEVSRIDRVEDVVDDMKNVTIEKIYSRSGELGVLEFTHLMEVVRTVDTIVDKAQDVSQELVRIFSAALS